MLDDNHAVFLRIVEKWWPRQDTRRLTPNQIANVALGNGNSSNAALVGRVLHEYGRYFLREGDGHGRRYFPRWADLQRDFPDCFATPRQTTTPPTAADAFDDMARALRNEETAVAEDIRENPIEIHEGSRVPELESSGDIIYRFTYWQERADGYFAIPDGVPVRLVWPGGSERDGTLLSVDEPNWQLYVALEQALEPAVARRKGAIRPKLEELVAAMRRALERARDDKDGLQHRLLAPSVTPRPLQGIAVGAGLLDPSQRDAVKAALSNDITFVWGPPGTGKTHTIGEILAAYAAAGVKTLALATANVAVDQMCLKTRDALQRRSLHRLLDDGAVLRIGRARDPEVLRDRRFFPNVEAARNIAKTLADLQEKLAGRLLSAERRAQIQKEIAERRATLRKLTEKYLLEARIVLTSVLQPCLDPAFDSIGQFEAVVVDEASMLSIPYLLASVSRARTRVCIAGDFRQLGPIALSMSEAAQRWLHRDGFDLIGVSGERHPVHPALTMLRHQRRMHPDISRCVNEQFYGGLLLDAVASQTTRASEGPPCPGRGAVFLDISEEKDCAVEATAAGSRKNEGSARRAASLAAALARRSTTLEVAIITPYRAQVIALESLLDRVASQHDRARIRVGTIHTFQGSERDIVIWDLVDNRHHPIGRLYRGRQGDRLTNVAMSRAKGKLLMLGDPKAFQVAPGGAAVGAIKVIIMTRFAREVITWHDVSTELDIAVVD